MQDMKRQSGRPVDILRYERERDDLKMLQGQCPLHFLVTVMYCAEKERETES